MFSLLQSDIEEIYNRLHQHRHLIDNKKFLIAGGNGFLGKYFQAVLKKFTNTTVDVIDKSKPTFKVQDVNYHAFDILDMAEMCNQLEPNYDYVFASASIASPKVYKQFPIETLDVGYIGLKNCLDFAKISDAKVLFFSSSEVYGTAEKIPTPETYVGAIPSDNERSCYDLSKIVGSSLIHYYVQKKNLKASIVLPFNFYGPQEQDGRVMPSFMEKIIKNKQIEIFNGGGQRRCYTYITDGIVGCMLVLLNGKLGEKYNIGNPNDEISVYELANKIEIVIGKNIDKNVIDYPESYAGKGDPTRRVPDIYKAVDSLGFEPIISLNNGINRFYNWAKENYRL